MYAFFFYMSECYGGAERRLTRIFNQIAKDGYKFDLIVIGNERTIYKFLENNITNCYLNIIICKNILTAIKTVLKKRYDVICYYDACFRIIPIILASIIVGSKRLMTIASIQLASLKFTNIKTKLIFNFVLAISNHIDVLYPSKVLSLQIKYNRKFFSATPNSFTDLNDFSPDVKENIITFVSRLVESKNPKLFLEGIAICQDFLREKKYKIYLCGNGLEYDNLLRYVNKTKINDIVEFKGYINVKSVLPISRVFLSLQSDENYPSQSLIEAISSGCYIIASDKGDTRAIVKETFGCLIQLDSESVSNAIIKYINMKEDEKENIVINSREFALRKFNISTSYQYFKKIILDLGEKL